MIADLNEIFPYQRNVLDGPSHFTHTITIMPTRAVTRRERIEQLWKEIKQKNNNK